MEKCQFARAPLSSRAISLILFRMANAIQDVCIRSTENLIAEACDLSHLGQNRKKES